ncbi:MAG: thiamine-phosphate kinase [Rhodospirillales bacterium RIFCSPLOWO2_12_FULL_58_28]|nr:MAG: thiamine-phosphate kinase [Rhodospirillales bacterium RIFCSPLOWO2_02_FULL_58_16]OHC79040.1 MAG: thiamine-phosphate kinase [Rhodospirillales bacterium RIFCSPLOWO2_12_FULL_58_28]
MGRSRKSSEFGIISRFFAPLAEGEPGAFGLTDDAALIPAGPGRLVITTDAIVAGIHFPEATAADLIAAKMLGVNLSDMAAMGATPEVYTLSLALSEDVDDDWLELFSSSLAAEQEIYRITLIGGDTVATTGPLTFAVSMVGRVEEGRELRRSGARPGDIIYVSGAIGDAALGLKVINGELPWLADGFGEDLADRYYRPQPRVELGRRLAGLAHAAIDVSDGLAADLRHVCAASGVAATLAAHKVPLSPAGRAAVEHAPELISSVLGGGDDYELLFTAPPEAADALARLSRDLNLPLTAVGSIAGMTGETHGVTIIDKNGDEIKLTADGYLHFA